MSEIIITVISLGLLILCIGIIIGVIIVLIFISLVRQLISKPKQFLVNKDEIKTLRGRTYNSEEIEIHDPPNKYEESLKKIQEKGQDIKIEEDED